MELSLTYNDIALVPRILSSINSRDQVDTKVDFLGRILKLPILSAPMKTITGSKMARKLTMNGCLPVMCRTDDANVDLSAFEASVDLPQYAPVVSIGATEDFLERAARYIQAGARILCIDTANGFHTTVAHAIKQLQKSKVPIKIIAGNIGSVEGYEFLHSLGVDAARVGIGNGSACSTSIATGIGMGQVSLLKEIKQYRKAHTQKTPMVIADGGITEPGDICKALALGADVVMIGRLFAGTDETPGEVITDSNGKYKVYSGEASRATKGDTAKYIEGVSTKVPCKGPVSEVIQELADGLRSSMAYMNCLNLVSFRQLPENCLIQLTQSARTERTPHIYNQK